MIISHQKKFIFFACSKTGTTTLEAALQHYHDGDEVLEPLHAELARLQKTTKKRYNPKHARPELVKEFIPSKIWDNYFKFVFVRNPWDRVVSQYFSSKIQNPEWAFPPLEIEEKHVDFIWERKKHTSQGQNNESNMQYTFVFNQAEQQLVDFIGHYEWLQEDFDAVCQHLDIPPTLLPHKNASAHKSYYDLYTPQAIARVEALYKKDIDLLGYEFNSQPPKGFINPSSYK